MSFKLDASRFKKIKSDKHSTTLQHENGHMLTIQHKPLSPKMRAQMEAIPIHSEEPKSFANGGKVSAAETFSKNFGGNTAAGSERSKESPEQKQRRELDEAENAKRQLPGAGGGRRQTEEEKMYADGTPDEPVSKDDSAPTSSSQPQAPVTINIGKEPNSTPAPQAAPDPLADVKNTPVEPKNESNAAKNFSNGTFDFNKWALNNPDASPLSAQTGALQKKNTAEDLQKQQVSSSILGQKAEIDAYNQQAAKAGLPLKPYSEQMLQAAQTQQAAQAPSVMQGQPSQPQSAAPQGPNDPYGVNATMGAFKQGAGEIESGAAMGAIAQQQQGEQQAQALDQNIDSQQALLRGFQTNAANIQNNAELALQDYQKGHINPDHYLEHMGAGKKIATAIGLMLGGIAAGVNHTSNPALDFLQHQIDRDVAAQRTNLDKKANVFGGYMKMYGNERDAADMTTIFRRNIVEDQMKKAAAGAAGTAAAANMQAVLGKWHTDTAQLQGQMASRQTLLHGSGQGLIPPEMLIRTGVIPEAHAKDFEKQLGEAKNAVSLRDMTLNAFDQAAKLNTLGNRMLSPMQTKFQIDALLGPVLDKLTKDTSGRVTPQTTDLIGKGFHTQWTNADSVAKARQSIVKLISQGMHYPMLDAYQQNVGNWGAYDLNGNARIKERAPNVQR